MTPLALLLTVDIYTCCRLLNLGGSGDSGIRQTPEEMVNEMREMVKRFEEAADSAEERVQLARREANVRNTTAKHFWHLALRMFFPATFALCVHSLALSGIRAA